MAKELEVFALDDGANKHLTMTREQIIAAIIEAVNNGTIGDIDAGFITKIQELNNKGILKFWIGTNAEYAAITNIDPNTLYLFTDDPTIEDINNRISELDIKVDGNHRTLVEQVDTLENNVAVMDSIRKASYSSYIDNRVRLTNDAVARINSSNGTSITLDKKIDRGLYIFNIWVQYQHEHVGYYQIPLFYDGSIYFNENGSVSTEFTIEDKIKNIKFNIFVAINPTDKTVGCMVGGANTSGDYQFVAQVSQVISFGSSI